MQHHEFEREAVPKSAYKSYLSFLAIFAGRHTAGTEFTIGPLFIVHGASATDVVLGLLLGNVLATLSWRFICAPVAMKTRCTTFYQLEKICGKRTVLCYNLFVGVLLSMIAGAMCTVSATAIGDILHAPMPGLHDFLPSSWAFSAIVMTVAIITSLIAAFGYTFVARFSIIIVPYMLAVILYMGIQSLRLFKVNSFSDFWEVASLQVWTDKLPEPGFAKFGFWHCVCSAWFCDLLLHIGMLDLSILRYGKSSRVGWCSAIGMFAGHYVTWIVAGLLYALQLQADPNDIDVKPGPMAKAVAGTNGLVCVILAGWSTANPCLYEAGLAFQSVFGERSNTRLITIGMGCLAGVAGLFPAVVMRILELLAYGGLVVMPMGVVLFCDCFVLPRLELQSEAYENNVSSWPATITWFATNLVTLPLVITDTLAVFFAPLPGMLLAAVLYMAGSWLRDKRSKAVNLKLKSDELDIEGNANHDETTETSRSESNSDASHL